MNQTLILKNVKDEKYLRVFITGCLMFFLTILPIIIFTGGYYIYYGDYNSQQIPFYTHAHEFIKSEGLGWDWGTDLGANFVGSYSFYLLGSPFFWLTLPLPNFLVVFAMPVLLAVKHGLAAVTAYAFIRRFVRSKNAAFIGGLLYAFSGFQLFNIFFNHFHDVTAFFPLMLIALEEKINNDRKGFFAITVALMGIINYFFFTGQAVFVIIYILTRLGSPDFKITWKKFFSLAFEAVVGVMMAMVILLPAALGILGNYRINERLYGLNLVSYSDRTRILRIIQSFFMIPDVPARPNLFSSDNAKWASIGGYLPMFSMAGVIAFVKNRKKHWAVKPVIVCMICAFIPILNCMFYTFNSSYYARWYYMPILIMAMMTAQALDDVKINLRPAIKICGGVMAALAVIAVLPKKIEDSEEVVWFEFANYPAYFALVLAVSIIGLIILYRIDMLRRNGKKFMKTAVISTIACSVACTASVVYFGVSLGTVPSTYIDNGIHGAENLDLADMEEEGFYRLDISENFDNYPMLWGYSSMRAFQSTVPASIMEFYPNFGITRDVASRAPLENYTFRGLFSVRYYLERVDKATEDEYSYTTTLPGFTYKDTQNGFYIYENDYYIPMGFTYNYYITDTESVQHTDQTIERALLRAMVISEEDAEKYSDIIYELPYDLMAGLTETDYISDAQDRGYQSCSEFNYDSEGFNAKISLPESRLVFFSVPYEDGWTAYVNGEPADIVKANFGFMAVKCDYGENTIEFVYETPGLTIGLICTFAGITLLGGYLFIFRNKKSKTAVCSHYYDYGMTSSCQAEENYIKSILDDFDGGK
ncbi:MAG: YfhO family protein [Oscillospiraceae bacterium]|nr:YfhO family protein [Oscillospiraceae bacterium]